MIINAVMQKLSKSIWQNMTRNGKALGSYECDKNALYVRFIICIYNSSSNPKLFTSKS